MNIFEVGTRNLDGKYTKFMESPDRDAVTDYLDIMKEVVSDNLTIIFTEKTYNLTSSTPYIINGLNVK